jgi:hypothetical protein
MCPIKRIVGMDAQLVVLCPDDSVAVVTADARGPGMTMNFGLVVPLNGQFACFYFDNQDGSETWMGPATFGTVKQAAGVGGTLDIGENEAGVWVAYNGTEIIQFTQAGQGSNTWAQGPVAAAVPAFNPNPPVPPVPSPTKPVIPAGPPGFSDFVGAMVVPDTSGQLAPYTRAAGDTGAAWKTAGTPFGQGIDSAVLIFSTYDQAPDKPPSATNEWEVVAHQGNQLAHFFHDSGGWHTGETFASGATGRPGFVQSTFGTQPNTNFEVVVPMAGGLTSFWRNNAASGTPWEGPIATFGPGNATAAALIQSSDSSLHVVAAAGGELVHFTRASQAGDWAQVATFANGASGAPGLIQYPVPLS